MDMINTACERARVKIAEGHLDLAIGLLRECAMCLNSETSNEIVLLSSRLARLKDSERRGLIREGEREARYNQLVWSTLDFISELQRAQSDVYDSRSSGVVRIFYSYAREDEDLRDLLDIHLSSLQAEGKIAAWHDREILAGDDWDAKIVRFLETATVILFLVSPDFMASPYIQSKEVEVAMNRYRKGHSRIIPVMLRPVDCTSAPFARLQALPRDARPVTLWENVDEAFQDVASGLRTLIDSITV